jgi:hypothetical protein
MEVSTVLESSENFILKVQDKPGIKYFETNERGIINLKVEFGAEAKEFLLLRKGEDALPLILVTFFGIINSLNEHHVGEILGGIAVLVKTLNKIKKLYPEIKKLISQAEENYKTTRLAGRNPKEVRILCCSNKETEEARPLYEAQGYQVRFYADESLSGSHRYYLNEKRFCLFLRTSKKHFFGFIGDDPMMLPKN